MKNTWTILTSVFVILVLLAYMCTFEVRSTEVAIIKTAGRPADSAIHEPGLKFKLPWPIQSVVKYDNRKRVLLDKTEETGTRDEKTIILSTYTIWQIDDPSKFHENFPNEDEGIRKLRTLVQTCKNQEVGKRLFAEFVSVDESERKLRDIEATIMQTIRTSALDQYGVEVLGFGIRKLGVPEKVTSTVFGSMKAAQQAKAETYVKEGEARAAQIIASARATEEAILAEAQKKVSQIEAEAQQIISQYYKQFDRHPELRIFLDQLQGVINGLKSRTTIIFDTSGPPFNLFEENFMGPATDARSSDVAGSVPDGDDAEGVQDDAAAGTAEDEEESQASAGAVRPAVAADARP
ncbi:MAG: hypothetical protein C4547_16675 [Phycisphaerales bacterium]|nr:MAG: hypothetical protein C4547_16675 [Phycisphaerales bacterium]